MDWAVPTMTSEMNAIAGLVLHMVERKLPIDFVVSRGYTSGQVMRALVKAREVGMIEVIDGKTRITEIGRRELKRMAPRIANGQWLMPLDEERIESMSVHDIFLPANYRRLDK